MTFYLQPAFDQIERSNHGVGDTAGEETSEAAVSVVGATAELARVLLSGSCSELPAAACIRKHGLALILFQYDR
jgi:hypothetical protein